MATQNQHKSKRPRKTPDLTRNGRVRYMGLNLKQLQTLIEKTNVKKTLAKYKRRLAELLK